MSNLMDRKGFLQVSLALVLGTAVLTAFGLWVLLHQWKGLVDTQLRLDKCTGEIALSLKSDLGKVKEANTAILAARAAITAAMAIPGAQETVPPLQASLHLIYTAQEAIRAKWELKAVRWVLPGSCGDSQDLALPFSPLSWDRPPPDTIGENQIDLDSIASQFRFEAFHLPRKAAAVLEKQTGDENAHWNAHWSTPRSAKIFGS